MEKKLYRSNKDKRIAGVCSGIAEYFNIDVTIVRLLWVLFCFVAAGILAYLICAIVIPEQPRTEEPPKADEKPQEPTEEKKEN